MGEPKTDPVKQALTALTPLRPGGRVGLRLAFEAGDRMPWLIAKLLRLSFIHFARWSVVRNRPGLGGRDLLLFESDFDGDWDEYIDDFTHVLGFEMQVIWGTSYGFPGLRPSEGFRSYIHHNQLVPRVTYAANPGKSTTQILAALKLTENFAPLLAAAQDPDADAAAFAQRWQNFLTEMQLEL